MKSLQLRLSLGLSISLMLVFLLLWQVTTHSIADLSEQYIAMHLQHDGESLLQAINIDQQGQLSLDSKQIEPVYLRPFSGQYFRIVLNNNVLRSRSLWDQDFAMPLLAAGETQQLYRTGPQQQPLIMLVSAYKIQGQTITIAVAENLSPSLVIMDNFQHRYSMIALLLLALLLGIQIIILRLSFRPLKRIQIQIDSLERGERTQLDTDVPEEVALLVSEVNRLLSVLQQRLQDSRNSLGDLAHALKTPLTVVQQLVNEEALQAQPDICNTLNSQTIHMQRLMNRVLKRSRLAGGGPATTKIEIHQELSDLINAMQRIYQDKKLSIALNVPEKISVLFDREDMLELAGNLVDNACKWAHSSVQISIFLDSNFQLIIEDDGPGVSTADLSKLNLRGTRLDESTPGHGLGLSIAQCIVNQNGGELTFGRSSKLGGFRVVVQLPLVILPSETI
ncbi:histidine kinase [Methyloprofundus sedimenti]|uniref:histidine kinase n=1 Tax=Methyloprofundus sedimenti TaxID=1420851 RepID=A0A1V8M9C4_9GAMM|nr:sensor histidine kinase [Methyloprofundus sedimenti]OQK18127.1 histidine kinase [Methyloprofundus sedimenti]